MTDPAAAQPEHQLAVIRAFLRQRFRGAELIDRSDATAGVHKFILDPAGRTGRHTLLVPLILLRDPALAPLLTDALVEALKRAGARPVTVTARGIRY